MNDPDDVVKRLDRLYAATVDAAIPVLELLEFVRENPEILANEGMQAALQKITNEPFLQLWEGFARNQRKANAMLKDFRQMSVDQARSAIDHLSGSDD